jgi:peptidylprolyl isomerase
MTETKTHEGARGRVGGLAPRRPALALVALLAAVVLTMTSCGGGGGEGEGGDAAGGGAPAKVRTESGLEYQDLVAGTGPSPTTGQVAVVHYTGWLTDETKFDSSVDRGKPFEFPVGRGQVIKGWDEGVASMRVGGKRKLWIPSALAYGERGVGNVIPANADLVFEVELLEIR